MQEKGRRKSLYLYFRVGNKETVSDRSIQQGGIISSQKYRKLNPEKP